MTVEVGGALSRGHCFGASTRWGCTVTGPACGALNTDGPASRA